MRDYGAVRVRPNAEVSMEEMGIIANEGGVEVEVLAHGKIPLGITERCSLLSEDEDTDPDCPSACEEERWLTTRQWVLKTVGKGVLSGRDMCMLEHLPRLLADGFTIFRVEGLYETSAYRSEIGWVYREALDLAASGKPYEVKPEWVAALRRHSREGFCNGYYFGKTGRLYVGPVLQEDKYKV
jgi:putative protease